MQSGHERNTEIHILMSSLQKPLSSYVDIRLVGTRGSLLTCKNVIDALLLDGYKLSIRNIKGLAPLKVAMKMGIDYTGISQSSLALHYRTFRKIEAMEVT